MVKVLINSDLREGKNANNEDEFRTESQEEKEKLLKTAGLVLGGTVIE